MWFGGKGFLLKPLVGINVESGFSENPPSALCGALQPAVKVGLLCVPVHWGGRSLNIVSSSFLGKSSAGLLPAPASPTKSQAARDHHPGSAL